MSSPNLLGDTWLLRVAQVSTAAAFALQRTTVIRCEAGLASLNPEYRLENLATMSQRGLKGVDTRHLLGQ